MSGKGQTSRDRRRGTSPSVAATTSGGGGGGYINKLFGRSLSRNQISIFNQWPLMSDDDGWLVGWSVVISKRAGSYTPMLLLEHLFDSRSKKGSDFV